MINPKKGGLGNLSLYPSPTETGDNLKTHYLQSASQVKCSPVGMSFEPAWPALIPGIDCQNGNELQDTQLVGGNFLMCGKPSPVRITLSVVVMLRKKRTFS